MRIEPVTQAQVDALARSLSPAARIVIDIYDVDISRGRGVLDPGDSGQHRHCLWTHAGHRVDISAGPHGLIVSQSRDPDPLCPGKEKEGEE